MSVDRLWVFAYFSVALFAYAAVLESSTKTSWQVILVAVIAGLAWPVFLPLMFGLIVGKYLHRVNR